MNHLHWQGMYLRVPLPLELQPRQLLGFHRSFPVHVEEVLGWPLTAWAFTSSDPDALAAAVFPVVQMLLHRNFAHNLYLTHADRDQGSLRVFVMPRRPASFPDPTHVQVAATEAFGWWIHPDEAEYADFTETEHVY